VELWEVDGFRISANTEPDYLNVEQAISLDAGSTEANQLAPCSHDVIACILHVKDLSACVL